MTQCNFYKRLLVVTMALVLALALAGGAAAAKKKSVLTKKLHSVEKKIKVVKQEIARTETKRRTVIGQLSATEHDLETAQNNLSENKFRLLDAQSDLKMIVARLARTRHQLARRRGLFTRRVVDIYEGDDLNYVDVVLGSTDMWTFLTRAYYLQQILKGDTVLIAQIRADESQIKSDEMAQTRRVAEISSREKRLVGQRDQVAALAQDKHDQLDTIEHDKNLYTEALDELEAESQQIETEIRAYQNTPRGRAMQARPFVGGLQMPCHGPITSGFGYRMHPITHVYKLHTGVDIGVPTGTPIHAAADGIVVRAQWYGAYGYAVVIDHGGGVQTLYGHNSKLCVSAGQSVKRGQVVAISGATGYATGPHCHFEKRVNGVPVNPL